MGIITFKYNWLQLCYFYLQTIHVALSLEELHLHVIISDIINVFALLLFSDLSRIPSLDSSWHAGEAHISIQRLPREKSNYSPIWGGKKVKTHSSIRQIITGMSYPVFIKDFIWYWITWPCPTVSWQALSPSVSVISLNNNHTDARSLFFTCRQRRTLMLVVGLLDYGKNHNGQYWGDDYLTSLIIDFGNIIIYWTQGSRSFLNIKFKDFRGLVPSNSRTQHPG